MAIIQQDDFHDTDGTALLAHSPAVGSWTFSSDPRNMVPAIHANRLTGTTNLRRADLTEELDVHDVGNSANVNDYDITAGLYCASVLGTRNDIGVTFRDDDDNSWYRVVYRGLTGTWHLDLYSGTYYDAFGDGNDWEPQTADLDTHAQALTAGQSVTLKIEVRAASVTVFLDGTQVMSTADVSFLPTNLFRAGMYGVYMYGGTPTTGLMFTSFLVNTILPDIPQGTTQTIPAPGSRWPSVHDRLFWEVYDPSATVIADIDGPGLWNMTAPDVTHLSVTVPLTATVAEGYEARFKPSATDDGFSGGFNVTPGSGDGGGGGGGGTPPARRRRVCGC